MASEIFNCEINQLLDRFFDAPEHQKKEESETEEEHEEEVSDGRLFSLSVLYAVELLSNQY